jgi:hypothetical protein
VLPVIGATPATHGGVASPPSDRLGERIAEALARPHVQSWRLSKLYQASTDVSRTARTAEVFLNPLKENATHEAEDAGELEKAKVRSSASLSLVCCSRGVSAVAADTCASPHP